MSVGSNSEKNRALEINRAGLVVLQNSRCQDFCEQLQVARLSPFLQDAGHESQAETSNTTVAGQVIASVSA